MVKARMTTNEEKQSRSPGRRMSDEDKIIDVTWKKIIAAVLSLALGGGVTVSQFNKGQAKEATDAARAVYERLAAMEMKQEMAEKRASDDRQQFREAIHELTQELRENTKAQIESRPNRSSRVPKFEETPSGVH